MKYVGMFTQVARNRRATYLLLLLFPGILLALVWVFLYIVAGMDPACDPAVVATGHFMQALPWVLGGVGLWFIIAYCSNTSIIRHATGAQPLERRDNPRLYNIVENLCMTCGMPMPQVNIVEDRSLNAFASGIDQKSYTVTVTRGLLETLDDRELAGVIGHELTHIRNRDTQLLIVSIVFVGIITTLVVLIREIGWRVALTSGGSRRDEKQGGGAAAIVVVLVAMVLSWIGMIFVSLTRFAISRKREYMADAGGAELCGDPLALASALRKIKQNTGLTHVEREDVAQLFIHRDGKEAGGCMDAMAGAFSTHPDIDRRIAILEQF